MYIYIYIYIILLHFFDSRDTPRNIYYAATRKSSIGTYRNITYAATEKTPREMRIPLGHGAPIQCLRGGKRLPQRSIACSTLIIL